MDSRDTFRLDERDEPERQKPSRRELCEQASDLLRSEGFNWSGRQRVRGLRGDENYRQGRFEYSMRTGAYSANCSRRK